MRYAPPGLLNELKLKALYARWSFIVTGPHVDFMGQPSYLFQRKLEDQYILLPRRLAVKKDGSCIRVVKNNQSSCTLWGMRYEDTTNKNYV